MDTKSSTPSSKNFSATAGSFIAETPMTGIFTWFLTAIIISRLQPCGKEIGSTLVIPVSYNPQLTSIKSIPVSSNTMAILIPS